METNRELIHSLAESNTKLRAIIKEQTDAFVETGKLLGRVLQALPTDKKFDNLAQSIDNKLRDIGNLLDDNQPATVDLLSEMAITYVVEDKTVFKITESKQHGHVVSRIKEQQKPINSNFSTSEE